MRALMGIGFTGATAIYLHPLRSFVTTGCLLVVLVPYLVGIGISKGVQQDAKVSLAAGADLYVSGLQFGREIAIAETAADAIRQLEGVDEVIPRIVGPITLGSNREQAVVVGVPLDHVPAEVQCVEGRLFRSGSVPELVLGSELAKRLKVGPGDLIPPFYHSAQGERVSKIVGIFDSDVALWQARLIFTSLETAQLIFDQPQQVTGLLVNCRTGYEENVRRQIARTLAERFSSPAGPITARVVGRGELTSLLARNLLHREGIFNLHFVLVFISGMLVILVTSGMGLPERRRETGILKAVGWQTDEILLRNLCESFLLGLLGAALSILMAYTWLRALNGFWIASIFLPGAKVQPEFRVPFRLAPIPVLLALILSFVLVMTGTLVATWRAATVPPREAMG